MSINIITYANQTVSPTNDAIIYEKAVKSGIFYGCNVTVSGNSVNVAGGYGIVCGREFTIENESITVTLAGSGTLLGRVYVRLDLSNPSTPIQLLTATGSTLPALTQEDDANYTNGVYEMELATFTVGVSELYDVAETFNQITPSVQTGQITAGNISPVTVPASSTADAVVTFDAPFSKSPIVVACLQSSSVAAQSGELAVGVFAISATGFTCRIFNNGTSSRAPGIEWIAYSV